MKAHDIDPASFLLARGIWPQLCTALGQPLTQALSQWLYQNRIPATGRCLMKAARDTEPTVVAKWPEPQLQKALDAVSRRISEGGQLALALT